MSQDFRSNKTLSKLVPRDTAENADKTATGTSNLKLKHSNHMTQPGYEPPYLNNYFKKLYEFFDEVKGDKNVAKSLSSPFEDILVHHKLGTTEETMKIKAFPVRPENLTSLKESSKLFGELAKRYIALKIDNGLIKALRSRYAKNGVQMVKFATNHNQKLGLNWSVLRNRWEHFTAAPDRNDGKQNILPEKSGYKTLLNESITLEPDTAKLA